MMGWKYDVYGWAFGDRLGTGVEKWHYAPLYQGNSLIRAAMASIGAWRHYGCVKLELRP
jgi:hypothetical protein